MGTEFRFPTTHVGSLPRPPRLLNLMKDRSEGKAVDAGRLAAELASSVKEVVRRQVEIGIDFVSDGEFSKPSYATYVADRLTGFEGEWKGHAAADLKDYPDYTKRLVAIGGVVPKASGACCRGEVRPKSSAALDEDLRNFASATAAAKPNGAFMNAASPGVVALFQKNEFYPSEDAYIEAIAAALRPEYEAIAAAGFLLQIDSPDLAMGRHLAYAKLDDRQFLKILRRNVAALNEATKNIPPERMRMHVCWGNYPGPHHRDIPLDTIVDSVLKARPSALLVEGANPRHEHEWSAFRTCLLPEDKVLVPGVVDSTSNYVEHPELVSHRIARYVHVVGRDRVIASTDCGFSTFSGYPTVDPEIAWAKLASLVEGARLASGRHWAQV